MQPMPTTEAPPHAVSAAIQSCGSAFVHDSMMCRIVREALVLLSGGRAVLLQLAHPLIAEGVAQHSDFRADPLARLFRTMLFVDAVLLDDDRRPEALERFHAMHETIRGRLSEDAGPFEAGTPYIGSDPHLKLWVHATLVDSCLKAYELFVAPLTDAEHRDYFSDSVKLARLLKIPNGIYPKTPRAFKKYMNAMLESDSLVVTDKARSLGRGVLYPDVGVIPSASAGLLRFVTAGLLPDRLRREFGLEWSPRRQKILQRIARASRALRPHVPRWIWESPLLDGKLARLLLWGMSSSSAKTAARGT